LNLIISININTTDVQTACDFYTWIDGATYTVSNNTATHTLTAAAGCDSIVTLDLTINNNSASTDTQIACDSYVWIDGNTYTSSNNNATQTFMNAVGCDSIVTLDLTINNSNSSTDTYVECDSFTWIDGNVYSSNNNTATFTLTNVAGCDSVVALDLTINNSTAGIDIVTTCGTYFWIDGNVYTSNNTTATYTIASGNSNGCDSIVTLNLTVGSSSSGTDVVSACGSYVWIDGNTYTSNNTTAIYTIINGNVCDSLVNLNLTLNSTNITTSHSNDSIWSNALNAAYKWLDCNNSYAVVTGETNALLVATSNGDYAVEITQNGCTDTSACVNIITLEIDENSFGNKLLLFPNPTNRNFSIDLGQQYQVVKITITDVSGKPIQSNIYNESKLLNLQLEEPAGVYLMKIESENNKAVIRLVKE